MLELTMASVTGADADATAGMLTAGAPGVPGSALRVGRDPAVCRLVTPEDWLFVSRVHLEFRCGPAGEWAVGWLRGSQDEPSSEVWLTTGGGPARPLGYGTTAALPRDGSGDVVIKDRAGPRSVHVGFWTEGGAPGRPGR